MGAPAPDRQSPRGGGPPGPPPRACALSKYHIRVVTTQTRESPALTGQAREAIKRTIEQGRASLLPHIGETANSGRLATFDDNWAMTQVRRLSDACQRVVDYLNTIAPGISHDDWNITAIPAILQTESVN